jgi:hypothetical protein
VEPQRHRGHRERRDGSGKKESRKGAKTQRKRSSVRIMFDIRLLDLF